MSKEARRLKVDADATLVVIDGLRQTLRQLGIDCETYLADIPNVGDAAQQMMFDLMMDVGEHLDSLNEMEEAVKADLEIFGNNYADKELFYDDGALMPADGKAYPEGGEDCRVNCRCLSCPYNCGCFMLDTEEDDEEGEEKEEGGCLS